MSTHPKWKYHPDKPSGVVVQSVEEEDALGEGWVDSPAHFEGSTPEESDDAPQDDSAAPPAGKANKRKR